jgi:RsiW-degrading membrane proteinase PrsW (M82 family)
MKLLILSIAPIVIILFYIYYRDKYEKEPILLLVKAVAMGFIIVIPVVYVEKFLMLFIYSINGVPWGKPFYNAFVVAAFTEEIFKFAAVYILIWKHEEFNEKFDGIVYAVFVSLGFALVENVLYVFGTENGTHTALIRAFTAVPAHAMFGILMGYHIGLAKFFPFIKGYKRHLFDALWVPIVFHGIYDFILMVNKPYLLFTFFPFIIIMFVVSNNKMNTHSNNSIYKYYNENKDLFD